MQYSDQQIEDLLKGIHDGTITDRNLPKDLYLAIADYLKTALYEGFGGDLADFEGEVLDTLLDLRENIYLFSGAKTFQFVKEAGELLTDENGKLKPLSQYKAEAQAVYGKYNEDWLAAEHKTTVGQAQQAQRWQDIEANKDILPMLKFSTNGKPCPICNPFDGLTAPVGDKIWKIASPLLHFGCFCILESYDSSEPASDETFLKQLQPNMDKIPDLFRNNPGQTGEVFNKHHPYFDVPKEDKKFAKNNFNLPIPDKDVQL
ncbi:hypothetical protein J3L18_00035 [Mucilaginibacter gossypii]|uniref:hypothetical protein n=1 Tax=Mucilaginibacter gossypii TaxID=551996 RepID=UPI000DCDE371|nr:MULTISPECIES: hypothetical protein [Mucilaginibacter]QTE37491.1 hypothetical protein J3L18_00035 [Mucilaginibacter gossypii]RAV52316.1 hypothetical protein DIU36_24590 [Mucilaginibacter rubeus]